MVLRHDYVDEMRESLSRAAGEIYGCPGECPSRRCRRARRCISRIPDELYRPRCIDLLLGGEREQTSAAVRAVFFDLYAEGVDWRPSAFLSLEMQKLAWDIHARAFARKDGK